MTRQWALALTLMAIFMGIALIASVHIGLFLLQEAPIYACIAATVAFLSGLMTAIAPSWVLGFFEE